MQYDRAQHYLDIVGVIILALDKAGRITLVNRKGCEILGYPEQDLIGRDWFDQFVPAEVSGEVRAVFATLMNGAVEPVEYHENEIIVSSGERRQIAWHNSLTYDEHGELSGLLSSGEDITGRREAEERLRLSEAKLRTLIDTLPDLVWLKDPDGVYLACNNRFEQFFGASEERITGKTDYDFVDEKLADFFRAHDQAAIDAVRPMVNEEEVTFVSDGHKEYLETIKTPMFDTAGNLLGVLGIGRDITRRVEAEARLKAYSETLEQDIETKSTELEMVSERIDRYQEALIDLYSSQFSDIAAANRKACEIATQTLHVARASIWLYNDDKTAIVCQNLYEPGVGHTYGKTLNAGDFRPYFDALASRHALVINDAQHDSRTRDLTKTYLKSSGITSLLDVPLFYEGEVAGVVSHEHIGQPRVWKDHEIDFATNIASLVSLSLEIDTRKRIEASLEETVSTRTAESNEANAAKGRFLANMSHEIRTPLGGVIGLSRMGEKQTDVEAMQQLFGKIRVAGNHLLSVVNDILDFSKLEAGKLSLGKEPFNLKKVLREVLELNRVIAEDRGLSLHVSYAKDTPNWFVGDPLRLKQVLLNLLSNAIKFTDKGFVKVGVSRRDGDLVLTVEDSGVGIDDTDVVRLFQPFDQLDTTTTREHGGTGLGLAISYGLARQMGGDISLTSTPGQGSTFMVRLPLAEAERADSGPEMWQHRDDPDSLLGLRVLVAEDVEINRLVIQDILEGARAQVVMTENGAQAVAAVEAAAHPGFDVVLMDIQMPVMDGYEATRRIRASNPGLPIIGVTAHAMREEREKTRAAGMVGHVTKPIDPVELVTLIRQTVD